MRSFRHHSSPFSGFRAILLTKAAPPSEILALRARRQLSKRRQIHRRGHHFERRLQNHQTWPVHGRPVGLIREKGVYLAGLIEGRWERRQVASAQRAKRRPATQ